MKEPRRTTFEHAGHRFETIERLDSANEGTGGDPHVRWEILMDGRIVLEFAGPFQYSDADLRKRVLEWYAIQKPMTP